MIEVYGVLSKDDTHIDVSKSLLGAKIYATRNGYDTVTKRVGYNARVVATKRGGKWTTV